MIIMYKKIFAILGGCDQCGGLKSNLFYYWAMTKRKRRPGIKQYDLKKKKTNKVTRYASDI